MSTSHVLERDDSGDSGADRFDPASGTAVRAVAVRRSVDLRAGRPGPDAVIDLSLADVPALSRAAAAAPPPVVPPAAPPAGPSARRPGAAPLILPPTRTGATDVLPQAPEGWMGRFGVQPLLVACDLAACVSAGLLAPTGGRIPWVFASLLLVLYAGGHLYRSRLSLSLLDDLPRLTGRWLAAVGLTILAQAGLSRVRWGDQFVHWRLVWPALIALALIVVLRASAYALVRHQRRRRRVAHRALVIGAGTVGGEVAGILTEHPEYGLQPVGFLDDDPWLSGEQLLLPVLGGTDDLMGVLTRYDVGNVVVAFASMRESELVDIIRTCDRMDCEIFLVPRLFELHHVSDDMDEVWGLPLVRLRRAARRSRGWHVKRVFDVALAGAALLALAPVFAVVAALVRREGGPGVLFRQERVSVDGRRFELLKFRSLRPVDETESATNWNIAHDDRLGPVGRFLRKTSIDELPQLINILRGEMSLVGPRPERPHFVHQFTEAHPGYVARHRVPSGLTGWEQVHGLRGDTSIADRAKFDNYYIENWSLWLDIKIILRTVGSVLRGTGA